jgi:hypothetical protein
MTTGANGRGAFGYINVNGDMIVTDIPPSDTSTGSPPDISAGTTFSFLATYIVP